MVMGGGGRLSRVFRRSFERRRHKNCVFHAEERIYNLQISLSKLVSLSENPFLTLSVTFRTGAISSRVGICVKCDN